MSMYRALCLFLDDLKESISSAIGCKLYYYEEVIEDILPIDWRPRSELDSKYNLGSKSYDKTGQVSGQ